MDLVLSLQKSLKDGFPQQVQSSQWAQSHWSIFWSTHKLEKKCKMEQIRQKSVLKLKTKQAKPSKEGQFWWNLVKLLGEKLLNHLYSTQIMSGQPRICPGPWNALSKALSSEGAGRCWLCWRMAEAEIPFRRGKLGGNPARWDSWHHCADAGYSNVLDNHRNWELGVEPVPNALCRAGERVLGFPQGTFLPEQWVLVTPWMRNTLNDAWPQRDRENRVKLTSFPCLIFTEYIVLFNKEKKIS